MWADRCIGKHISSRQRCSNLYKQKEDNSKHMKALIEGKVVQDIDGSGGDGLLVSDQGKQARIHVLAPILTTAHYIRIASAFQ